MRGCTITYDDIETRLCAAGALALAESISADLGYSLQDLLMSAGGSAAGKARAMLYATIWHCQQPTSVESVSRMFGLETSENRVVNAALDSVWVVDVKRLLERI